MMAIVQFFCWPLSKYCVGQFLNVIYHCVSLCVVSGLVYVLNVELTGEYSITMRLFIASNLIKALLSCFGFATFYPYPDPSSLSMEEVCAFKQVGEAMPAKFISLSQRECGWRWSDY